MLGVLYGGVCHEVNGKGKSDGMMMV
jgi:hypothetical protein